jgi:HSP20 family protein
MMKRRRSGDLGKAGRRRCGPVLHPRGREGPPGVGQFSVSVVSADGSAGSGFQKQESTMDYIKIRFVDSQEGVEPEFRKTLEDMLRAVNPRFTLSRHRWRPHIDIYETAEEIVILAEIAGIRREEINLEIGSRTVKIAGIREGGPRGEDASYRLAEIPCGYFERSLALPALIDTESAVAVYRDGLLEIRLTKRPIDLIHKIIIQSG